MTRRISPDRSPSCPTPLRPRALAELLEPRRLLAGIESGVLVARGTEAADTFSVRRSGGDDVTVTTNGVEQTFDIDDFAGVRLEGLGGNDTFDLREDLAFEGDEVRQITVAGGAGSDTVSYETRGFGVSFRGYFAPDAQSPVPYITAATAGDNVDRILNDVETIIGGSGIDSFRIDNGAEFDEDGFAIPDLLLEGRGANDKFGPAYAMTITQVGNEGDDEFEIDETAGEIILGGPGNDRFSLNGDSNTSINAGTGVDTLSIFGYLRESFDMGTVPGLENLEGAGSHTTLVLGNALNNRISAVSESSDVTMQGLGGNDTLVGGSGAESLLGGDGNDSLAGGEGVADDTLDGGAGTDTADGGAGDDTVLNAEVTPPPGAIRILNRVLTADGTWGAERITIERTGADDVIVRIEGLSRQFDMDDFDGVLLRGNNGYDFLQVLDPVEAGSLVRRVTLEGGNGDDTLDDATNAGNREVMRGGAGNDQLFGWSGDDALFGGTGNDHLSGSTGLDFLDGGDDDDFIAADGDGGGDTVQGGNGFDRASVDAGDQTANVEVIV